MSAMKVVEVVGPRKAGLRDAPRPEPAGGRALVKIHLAPMCAEYKAFEAGGLSSPIGHEAVGEVVEAPGSTRVKPGDRVFVQPGEACGKCRFCTSGYYIHCPDLWKIPGSDGLPEACDTMAQYMLKGDWLLMPIPDDMPYERAALACCGLGPSFKAFQKLGLTDRDTVLIAGVGPVGLGAVINARHRGARVLVVESVPFRVNKALELGAEVVIPIEDPDRLKRLKELTGGFGPDCAIDCAGNTDAERLCIDAVRNLGRVAFVGECGDDLHVRVSPDMIRKGLTICGSWHYANPDYFSVLDVVRNAKGVDRLVSHIMPMSEIQAAFEISAAHESAKMLLDPWR
jgi:L-iditol 2-dehydrogenase